MDMKLEESREKALDEIELLEFELEIAESFKQKLDCIVQLVKKQFLLELLKLMQPIESELNETHLNELRCSYRELTAKIDALIYAIRDGKPMDGDDTTFYILEKMLPYIKDSIKEVKIYKNSRQILITT